MNIEILSGAEAVARRGAELIGAAAREAIDARRQFLLAVSGGSTPLRMLQLLAGADIPWDAVHVFQVDERVVGASDAERNLKHLRTALLDRVAIPPAHVHAMPVDDLLTGARSAHAAQDAAAAYASTLRRVAGAPPVLDLVHLGLGADGHTASLVPGDPVLDVSDADVGVTQPYRGARRMTLTFPVVARARNIMWLVTGAAKRDVLARLQAGDPRLPASRVPTAHAVVLTSNDG